MAESKPKKREYLDNGVALQLRGETWWIDVYRGGKRVRKSLNTGDRSKAMAIGWNAVADADKIVDDAALLETLASGRRLMFPFQQVQVAEAVESLKAGALATLDLSAAIRQAVKAELGKPEIAAKDLATAIDEYGKYQRGTKGNREKHVRNVESILRGFADFAKVQSVSDVTRANVENYLASISELSPKTRKDRLAHVSAFLSWSVGRNYASANVAEGVEAPRVSKSDVEYHTSEELGKLLDAAKGDALEDYVKFALYTGMRRSEILKVEASNIDLAGRQIRIKSDKTGRSRSVPIMDELLPVLMRLPKKGRLFPRAGSGALQRATAAIWKRAKLNGGVQMLRHSFVSHLLLANVAPHAVASFAGHARMVQDQHYAGLRLGDKPFPMTCEAHGIGEAKAKRKAK